MAQKHWIGLLLTKCRRIDCAMNKAYLLALGILVAFGAVLLASMLREEPSKIAQTEIQPVAIGAGHPTNEPWDAARHQTDMAIVSKK